ncbi:uncharacterized protein PFL1_04154 [Pseudozyma flocculosa PF-1]|uniref:AB hydrolase-1 domain-containing protein n=2 Tax=Pseudozyma flocculosa TaxID=84751 RepID=A0A5C3EVF3_9BASI|nr:uncharacterized protein PFL1_04154 [Pseudozyma flocculosa PF-1]EPQ28327.1 hypothetical protein PFL1_04154 [Pseudozyma flocculosa PF-1]SPO35477.1 uncharacterized protein PSFLO_00948 [Pseudozyma flocculosa]
MSVITDFATPQLLPLSEPSRPTQPPRIPERRSRIAFTTVAAQPQSTAPPPTRSNRSTTAEQQQWIATSHFFPAAWPRSHARSARSDTHQPLPARSRPFAALPIDPQQAKAEEKRQRESDFAVWKQHIGSKERSGATIQELREQGAARNHASRLEQARRDNEEQLWACVQRIVPSEPSHDASAGQEGYTLIVSHANGLHKELWEPALSHIVQTLSLPAADGAEGDGRQRRTGSPVRIDEIWSFDCTHSGEAASVNRDRLGDVVSWFDHPRDVMQFLDHFLPPPPSSSSSMSGVQRWHPTMLPRTDGRAHAQKRKFILLGHSFGGTTMATLAECRPDSFAGLVLVDPAMPDDEARASKVTFDPEAVPLARGAVARRDAFGSASEVRGYCESKPYFGAWDAKVLNLHLRFGIRPMSVALERAVTVDDLEDDERKRQAVTWSNPKWLEADAFAQTWMSLYTLTSLEAGRRTRAWTCHLSMRGGKTSLVKQIPGVPCVPLDGNHLVVQEEPRKIGEAVARVILEKATGAGDEAKLLSTVAKPRL